MNVSNQVAQVMQDVESTGSVDFIMSEFAFTLPKVSPESAVEINDVEGPAATRRRPGLGRGSSSSNVHDCV